MLRRVGFCLRVLVLFVDVVVTVVDLEGLVCVAARECTCSFGRSEIDVTIPAPVYWQFAPDGRTDRPDTYRPTVTEIALDAGSELHGQVRADVLYFATVVSRVLAGQVCRPDLFRLKKMRTIVRG